MKSNNYFCEIEYKDTIRNKSLTKEKFIKVCNEMSCKYYGILHDKDYNSSGELKHWHYHLLIVYKNKIEKMELLENLSKLFDINQNAISIQDMLSFKACIKYLIHQGLEDKTLYSECEIITNDLLTCHRVLNDIVIDYEYIKNAVLVSEGNINILLSEYFTLQEYKSYRIIINDLVNYFISIGRFKGGI